MTRPTAHISVSDSSCCTVEPGPDGPADSGHGRRRVHGGAHQEAATAERAATCSPRYLGRETPRPWTSCAHQRPRHDAASDRDHSPRSARALRSVGGSAHPAAALVPVDVVACLQRFRAQHENLTRARDVFDRDRPSVRPRSSRACWPPSARKSKPLGRALANVESLREACTAAQ